MLFRSLFQGGVGGQPNAGGATAGASRPATKQVSGGHNTVGEALQPKVTGGEIQQQNPKSPNVGVGVPSSKYAGGGAFADVPGEQPEIVRTGAQRIVGGLGKILTNVGTAFGAPQIVKGGLGAKAQSWGGQTQQAPREAFRSYKTAPPKPSFIQGVKNQLRSVVQNWFSRLRSRRGRRWW